MKGFDLYRIALGYLGVIFVLCGLVVFNPVRWVWTEEDTLQVQDIAAPRLAAAPETARLASAQNGEAAMVAAMTQAEPDPTGAAGLGADALRAMSQAAVAGLTARALSAPQLADARPATSPAMAEVLAGIVAQSEEVELGEGDAPGQADVVPSPEAALVAGGSDVTYTVGLGDSLGGLALRFYGDSALFDVIFEANRGLMGSPDKLRVGQVLIIPGRS